MSEQPETEIKYDDGPSIIGKMWWLLAETLSASIQDTLISDGPLTAIHRARLAEACYWQALGEEGCISIRSLFPPPAEGGETGARTP